MSSTYYALCLSHDPALTVAEQEWHNGYAEALVAVRKGLHGHAACDVVIGRYSYPMIEVCCTGSCPARHADDRWTDVGWLRLLLLAGPEIARDSALRHVTSCWGFERASRLRVELDIEPRKEAVS